MEPGDDAGEALTGGYLLEFDTNYDEDCKFRSQSTYIPVNIKSPDPEEMTAERLDYIQSYVNTLDAAIAAAGKGQTATDPFQWLDRESMIDYWICFEVMANHEILHPKSIYFHKDRGGKLVAGPIWDFDYETLVAHTQTQWINYGLFYQYNEFPWYADNWWNLLMNDASFRADIKRRWQEWYPFLKEIPAFIERERAAIAAAERRNFARWPNIDTGHPNRDEKLSFDEAVDLPRIGLRGPHSVDERKHRQLVIALRHSATPMKRIGIISDTHGTFDDRLREFLRNVDEIWHAGDIGSLELADTIAAFKPLRAVSGNIDGGLTRRVYPDFAAFRCEGGRRADDPHRGLSAPLRPACRGEDPVAAPEALHRRPLPHPEGHLRPGLRTAAHQSRRGGRIRLPQGPHRRAARRRRKRDARLGGGRMAPAELTPHPSHPENGCSDIARNARFVVETDLSQPQNPENTLNISAHQIIISARING